MQNRKLLGSLMLLSATLMWGLAYSLQTISANNLGSFTIVFFKGIGSIVLIPYIFLTKRKIDKSTIVGGAMMGLVTFIGCFLQQKGLELTNVSKASFITALYIVIVPIIEMFMGKKLKGRMWIAIIIALVGLYFLCFSNEYRFALGDLLLLGGSFFFALQIMFIDKYSKICDGISLTFVSQITLSSLAFILAMILEKPSISDISSQAFSLFYIVFIAGLLAQSIQTIFQKDCGPTLASLLMSFESVFGAIGGWLILHQILSFREIIGCLLVFIAILTAES